MGSEAEADKRLCFFSKKYASDFAPSLGKTLKLGKIEGRRRRGQHKMRRLDGITDSMDMSLSKLPEIVKEVEGCLLQPMGSQRMGHDLATEQQHCSVKRHHPKHHPLHPGIRHKNSRNVDDQPDCTAETTRTSLRVV